MSLQTVSYGHDMQTFTGALRFVLKDGKRVLQQEVAIVSYSGSGPNSHSYRHWVDVPFVEQADNPAGVGNGK